MIKSILVAIALILVGIGSFIVFPLIASIADFLLEYPIILLSIFAAVGVQLIGHVLRAMRTKLFIDQAAKSSIQFQFGALSMGYLFNALLPFRIGELIRALVIAKRLHISFLYTFVSIIIERSTDIFFLSVLILIGGLVIGSAISWGLIIVALAGIILSSVILLGLVLLKNENKYLLVLINWFAHFFNDAIANRIRFKAWSLIFGLQSFFDDGTLVRRYVIYALASWACYLASIFIVIAALLNLSGLLQVIVVGVSPYVISFNPLDVNAYQQLVLLMPIAIDAYNLDMYARIIWAVLVLPMASIGLIALLLYRPGTKQTAQTIQTDPYVNKLMRHRDISQDFPSFLASYFSGNDLARILHKIEVSGDLSLVRYFKGGSDAITVLVLADNKLFVKKIIPIEYRDRLRAQYDWLESHKGMKYLVNVIGEQDRDDYYAIDLEYDPKNIPFFEYAHHNSLKQSQKILDNVWQALFDHLHKNASPLEYLPKKRDAYIEKHIIGCVEKAAASHSAIATALKKEKVVINGVEYDNLHQILAKIKKNKQAWRDIATYRESQTVHGDPSIDNILVSTKNDRPLIIDPAPDGNIINGAVFDMGKFMQSFYCGYEFLFRDEDLVELGPKESINYRDHRSEKYVRICKYVQDELAPKYLSESEQRAIIFHAGALLIRRLKHQVKSNPENALKMYAVGIKTLNDFLAQYN
jgi:hypothetical protein